jgi:hypothetical protein
MTGEERRCGNIPRMTLTNRREEADFHLVSIFCGNGMFIDVIIIMIMLYISTSLRH